MPVALIEAFSQGLLCNLLNPKVMLFLVGLFSQFINSQSSLLERGLFAAVLLAQCGIYWSLLVLLLQHAFVRGLFFRYGRYIDVLFGAALMALGIRLCGG